MDLLEDQDFADYTIKLMNDDKFYLQMKSKMMAIRHKNNWEYIAKKWIKKFIDN